MAWALVGVLRAHRDGRLRSSCVQMLSFCQKLVNQAELQGSCSPRSQTPAPSATSDPSLASFGCQPALLQTMKTLSESLPLVMLW